MSIEKVIHFQHTVALYISTPAINSRLVAW